MCRAPRTTLAGLTRRGFFVQRQDDYFSLHALIRDFALRTWPWPPEEAAALLRRAAAWLESQGQIEDALSTLAAAQAGSLSSPGCCRNTAASC